MCFFCLLFTTILQLILFSLQLLLWEEHRHTNFELLPPSLSSLQRQCCFKNTHFKNKMPVPPNPQPHLWSHILKKPLHFLWSVRKQCFMNSIVFSVHTFFPWKVLFEDRSMFYFNQNVPCGLAGKESACNEGDLGSIPGLERSPGEGKGYPLLYSDLENPMDCIVRGVTKSWTWLSDFHFTSLPLPSIFRLYFLKSQVHMKIILSKKMAPGISWGPGVKTQSF